MNYSLNKLANGIRVITVPIGSLSSATITIWVGTGSRSESPQIGGISHFLEHMVFKGGKKRQTAKEIAEAVDAIGGEFNAGTSKEWTNFYIKARSQNLDIAFDVLSDMVLYPLLKEGDIKREKGVITEEIGMYEDTPLWKIEDVFENLIYKGHSLGRDIIGTKETVRSFKRKDFELYRNKHYFPENIVITVSGGVNQKEVLALANKYFSELEIQKSKHKTKKEKNIKFSSKQKSPQFLLSSKKKDQAHFILGFRASEMDSKERFVESVLATIMGGGMSSRLFTEIREKRGLAYSVRASRDAYTDAGYIGIYAGVDPKKAQEAIAVTLEQCYGIKNFKFQISNSELLKAKEYIKGHIALGLEDTRAINSFFGVKELLLGKTETPEEVFKAIDNVTSEEVTKTARKIFTPQRLNLAIIGPYKDKSEFEKIIN